MLNISEIFETIDKLFEKSPKEAENYMITAMEEAKNEGENEALLKLYNELIGYYRQTSEREKLCTVIDETLELATSMKLEGTLSYGTTLLNIANAYRSIGKLDIALDYYNKANRIYCDEIKEKRLEENDMCIAGLYNNMSLLYQEMSDYIKAEELLKKALEIVISRNERFEIAVTYTNLANTMLMKKDYEASYDYAKEAIRRFKARGCLDAHYSAALSAMATCYYEWDNISMSKSLLEEAISIVVNSVGKNSQYERLMDSLHMCLNKAKDNELIKGLDLSKRYYEEYGKDMLYKNYKEYLNKITVGLVGEGSECYGFDDEYSKDHDFGPGFCIFVDDDVYDEIGEALTADYNALPKEYMGYKRVERALSNGRVGVIKTSDFFIKHLGTLSEIDYKNIDDFELAVITNGEVFTDNDTEFTRIRNSFSNGYPKRIRLMKISEDIASFSQTGQYNYGRMIEREDSLTASIMISEFIKIAMKLYHHIMNVYPPHDKWLRLSTRRLDGGDDFVIILEKILNLSLLNESPDDIKNAVDEAAQFVALKMYEKGDISDIDAYLANHINEILMKASIVEDSKEELVNKIAQLEFKAFDEVKNEGGRASCQDDWPTFSVMRKSQYLTWNKQMLIQYLYDFTREYEKGHNLITEKYGRMMESTAPQKYNEIKDYFPVISEQKKAIIEQVVALQMQMTDEFGKEYPKLAADARSFHSYEDNFYNTSYETYLRGEISTYSDKMLQLYATYVVECVKNNINIAKETISNTAILYGYKDIDEFEMRK